MKGISIKGITQGRRQFIPDEKALNRLDKSRSVRISFGHTVERKKKEKKL